MKRILPYIFILLILVGTFAPFVAFAQNADGQPCSINGVNGTWRTVRGVQTCVANNPTDALPSLPTASNVAAAVAGTVGGSLVSALNGIAGDFLSKWILSPIAYFIQKLTALLMGLFGVLLNYILQYTIVDMKSNLGQLTGINTAWKVIRDLMNIVFIFILVYEGIKLIIGQGDTAFIKRFITGIVLASLLINFSLFFTKVLIDASNILTIGMYNSMVRDADYKPTDPDYFWQTGLSNKVMQALGVQGIFDPSALNIPQNGADSYSQLTANAMSAVLFLIIAFVFFAVAVLFVVRYIVLVILLALSPVAYMGFLPGIKEYSSRWWNSFMGQLIFAPLFMIMMWVVLIMVQSMGIGASPASGWTTAFTDKLNGGSLNLMLQFAVIIGLVIAALVTSKSYATKGASQIKDFSNRMTAWAGGAVMGGTSRIGRNTVGRWGANAANDENLKQKAAEGNIRARIQLAAANRAATSTFDARNASGYKNLEGATGVKFGKASDIKKDNYKAIREQQEKDAAKAAERYKPGEVAYAAAKEADERLKAEKALAKDRLNSNSDAGRRFIQQEQEAKQEYFASDAWRNSETGKAEAGALAAVEAHKKANQEFLDKQKAVDAKIAEANNTIIPERKAQILEEVEALKKETSAKQKEAENLKKAVDAGQGAITAGKQARDAWKSSERTRLQAIADTEDEANKKALDKTYQNRIDQVAARVGQTGEYDTRTNTVLRRVGMVFGSAANAAGITSAPPRTKAEREALARKIKSAPKGKKSARDLMEEVLKETGEAPEKKEETPKAESGGAGSEGGGAAPATA
jgi:hypothetical protein